TATATSFTSCRYDRRRLRRGRPGRNQGAGPVEAVLRHALEGRKVDVHDPEPLRVAEPPLEVVEQAPDEVALDRSAGGDRTADRRDVGLEVRRPLDVVDGAVMDTDVGECRAVLRDVDR